MNPQDALVSVWAQNKEGRYQNYKSTFTILDIPKIDRQWLVDLENDRGYESQHAPKAWLCWVDKNEYKPLITEKKQNNQTTTSNFPCNFNFTVSNMNRFN